jgi:D-glycero-alpha-D-manno-heptose-7-phosphate kinase
MASSITSEALDGMYTAARRAGASGGKITGAGGGGFLLLFCPVERQPQVRAALGQLREVPFRLEQDGTKAVFNNRR